MTLLLDMGADINAANVAGDTAAHVALASPAILQFLADHGAKMDVKNKQGRTPLETALRARDSNEKSVALLRQLTGDFTTQVPEIGKGGSQSRRRRRQPSKSSRVRALLTKRGTSAFRAAYLKRGTSLFVSGPADTFGHCSRGRPCRQTWSARSADVKRCGGGPDGY